MRRVECWRQPDGRRSVPGGRGDDRGTRCAAARGLLLQPVARGPARSPQQQPAVAPQPRRRVPLRPLGTSEEAKEKGPTVVLPPTWRRHREEATGETETMNPRHIVGAAIVCLTAAFPAQAITLRCPPDSAKVGNTCIDTYEASVCQIDPANTTLVRKAQSGRVTLADLTAGGARLVSSPFCSVSGFPAISRRAATGRRSPDRTHRRRASTPRPFPG